ALMRQILRTNTPFLISGALLVSYDRIDAVLLSLMANNAVVGWYGAAIRLFDALIFLPNILIWSIMFPIFSKLSTTSDEALRAAFEKSINFLLLCSVPIAVLFIVAAPNIIGFLYGRSEFFIHSVPALQALAPGVIFLYINFPISTILLSKKHDRKIPILAAIALFFSLLFNITLIPFYQQTGAAMATTLTEFMLCCIGLVFIPRNLLPTGSIGIGLKALAASIIMAIAIQPILHKWNICLILPIAGFVYLIAATLFGAITREDYRMVFQAVNSALVRQKA
ncbi:MAG: oligosaccharide flippase family protein, partial [Ktedonobacteraceae bacterium]